jgi:hypothetical protein
MVFGQVFRALAGGDHLEPAGARPIDQFADQRGLVAIGERVDDAGLLRLTRQQRAGEHVGLHVDHDDVFAFPDSAARVRDAGGRVAGGFDDDLHIGAGDHRHGVVGDAGGGDPVLGPADGAAGGTGPVGGEIGDRGDVQPGSGGDLGEEHGAEFAGADQADADRTAGGETLLQEGVQVH